ncbi:MAG: hypothetical protein KKD00_07955 [Gammaproteobacteria bacterium]|nr:hypothetical protein [Gammaproteobacteria bacterium]
MSKAVLEINDHAMGLYNHNGLIVSSPGFVLAHGKQPLFGQQAVEQSRLHPVSTNNEFWYRLSMAPLSRPFAHFRHYADIAHGHLMHLAQESSFEGEVVVAVPASFDREQLAVLSGVMQHSPFKSLAIMDAAFIACQHLPENTSLVYVDLQLHQLSLTRLSSANGNVRRDAFAVVPGAGSIALSNAIVQVVTDAFIAQARFNPQHSAEWEQQLYNELPDWLNQFQAGEKEILVEIKTQKNSVQARVGVSEMLEALQPAFQKISQHFAQFVGHNSVPVILSERAAVIPGLAFCLKALPAPLAGEQLAEVCLRALPSLSAGTGVSYISSVPHQVVSGHAADTAVSDNPDSHVQIQPTHLVYQSHAWPLPLSASIQGGELIFSPGATNQTAGLFRIESNALGAVLHSGSADVVCDQKTKFADKILSAGDVIQINSIAADLQLIRVHT